MKLKHVAYLGEFSNVESDATFEQHEGFVVLTVHGTPQPIHDWTEVEDGMTRIALDMEHVESIQIHTRSD